MDGKDVMFMDEDSQEANSPSAENDNSHYDDTTLAVNENPADVKTLGQPLSEFMKTLDDYTPTIPDAVTTHYLGCAGFETGDARIVRLVSIATQKFVSDIVNDALQHCKRRGASSSNQSSKNKSKDKRYTLTMEDLSTALTEYGIVVRKPPYFT